MTRKGAALMDCALWIFGCSARQRRKLVLHCVRVLFRQISDEGELVHLPLIRLDQENNPENEGSEVYKHVKRESDYSHKRNHGQDSEPEVNHDQSDAEEQALERVETNEAVAIVGRDDEKDDRGNDGDVGQHPGNVVSHTLRGSGCDSGASGGAA